MRRTFSRFMGILVSTGMLTVLALPAAAANEAQVRVVHASPDAPNVDVWVDGATVLTDVPFTAVSDYLSLPAGDHNIQVTATGSTDPVIDADVTLDAGTAYTVAATGMLADIGATVLVDDRTPVDGQSKLRVFHASPSAPDFVDVAVTDGPILVEGLAYPEATAYLTVDAGTYPLKIRAAGETDAALTLDATLEAGMNYTAIAMDGGDAGVQVIVAIDSHTVPDTAMAPTSTSVPFAALAGVALLAATLLLGRRAVRAEVTR